MELAIPQNLIEAAEAATQELEQIDDSEERKKYIKSKSKIWKDFGPYLKEHSSSKCWYSECKQEMSFMDIDHFRPKCGAIRCDDLSDDARKDEGYPWLAFEWSNFRLSAQRSNRLSTNEETQEVEGKSSWFPLLNDQKATWGDRCIDKERPILIDPICLDDVRLLEVKEDGRIGPSNICIGANLTRVDRTCELLGLNLPGIKGERLEVMRRVDELITHLTDNISRVDDHPEDDEKVSLEKTITDLERLSRPQSEYAAAARARLITQGFPHLIRATEYN